MEHDALVGDDPLTPHAIDLHLTDEIAQQLVAGSAPDLHLVDIGGVLVVDAQVEVVVVLRHPSMAVGQRVDVAGQEFLGIMRGYNVADIDEAALAGIVIVERGIVGAQPDVVAVVGLDHRDAVCREHVVAASAAALKSHKLIAVVAAQPIPC